MQNATTSVGGGLSTFEETPRRGEWARASDAPGAFLFLEEEENGWLSGKETWGGAHE
jgi:hypothetical protein